MRDRIRNYLKKFVFIGAFGLILSYILFETSDMLMGPIVTISEPLNGSSVESGVIPIKGQAKNVSSLTVNGRPIPIEEKGDFYSILILSEGYNVINIEASDKINNKIKKRIEVVAKEREKEEVATTTEILAKEALVQKEN